jgi:hypothetical protein
VKPKSKIAFLFVLVDLILCTVSIITMPSPISKELEKNKKEEILKRASKRRRRATRQGENTPNNAAAVLVVISRKKKQVPAFREFDFGKDAGPRRIPVKQKARTALSSNSLPILILQRESGLWLSGSKKRKWQQKMLSTAPQNSDEPDRKWRPYAFRVFSFRQLQTPAQDAILGIDSSGSYAIALGGQRSELDESTQGYMEENPPLVFRFYGEKTGDCKMLIVLEWRSSLCFAGCTFLFTGLPSKAKIIEAHLASTGRAGHRRPPIKKTSVTPLIMTVPLSFILEDDRGEYFNLPALVPVSALFSADNTMGVAKVSSSESVREANACILCPRKR